MARGRGKRNYTTKGGVKVVKRAPALALVRAVAKKVVADALEDKYAIRGAGGIGGIPIYFNAAVSTSGECYPLLPPIVQGTNSNDRIGDKVRPKRLRIDFVVTANGSFDSSQINQVRVFVLQDKAIKNLDLLNQTPISTQLIENGGSTSGFSGAPEQIMRRINLQRYQVFRDKHLEILSGRGTTPQPLNAYNGTQLFVSGQQCSRFSVVIPTPATLHYSGPLSTVPNNFAPFFCLGYVQPDGNALPDAFLQRVACNWTVHMDYEDA